MWYIVDGAVKLEADVVTGIPVPERVTPQGTYTILEKMRNKTLRGDKKPDGTYEYETPVEYWMRVTWTGIGFHDANGRQRLVENSIRREKVLTVVSICRRLWQDNCMICFKWGVRS